MIAVIDYGVGNPASVINMLKKLRIEAILSDDLSLLKNADKLILSGVGAFDTGMQNLHQRKLVPFLNEQIHERKIPILGICLGMQLLTERSEEGRSQGLGWIKGDTVRFNPNQYPNLRIPNMGWNELILKQDSKLFSGISSPRFYFVHSYYVRCKDETNVIAQSQHGCLFAAAIQHNNIWGVQFHPEKSHKYGMRLLHNFSLL